MKSGLNPYDIAFLKPAIALLLLSVLLFRTPIKQQKSLISTLRETNFKTVLLHIGICALLGIFTLFLFETIAYEFGNASNVVVVLMAAAAIFALIFGKILLQETISFSAVCGTALAIIGIFVISWSGSGNIWLVMNASLAGLGYGLFSVLVKKYHLRGGIYLTAYLLLFGSLYLAVPFLYHAHPLHISGQTALGLLALAILPTILGFYCTTKALHYLTAGKTQVTELSEPIFAAALAWLFLQEIPGLSFVWGALCIVIGIGLINHLHLTLFSQKK